MSTLDKTVQEFLQIFEEAGKKGTSPYDTQAEVKRVEDGIAWVHIAGGVDETPVKLTVNAKAGDVVQVRVSGGQAFLIGNATAPPTDDSTALQAIESSKVAKRAATQAEKDAETAANAATQAQSDAQAAHSAATEAIETAESVHDIAVQAQEDAVSAHEAAEQAQEEAVLANEVANSAQNSANSAKDSATTAINQLSIVENVVGVLDLLQRNGQYELTQDIEVRDDKWYFTRSESEPYSYTVVPNPEGDPSEQGLYELVGIDESVRNYVSSHLTLTDEGLWLQTDGTATKVLLSSTDGVVIYGPTGSIIGKYGNTAQIGDLAGFHIEMTGTELGFYQADRKVAYISNNQLYISQSVVLQRMDLGIPVSSGGLGQWSWKVHPNGQVPSRNNLNLKWIG